MNKSIGLALRNIRPHVVARGFLTAAMLAGGAATLLASDAAKAEDLVFSGFSTTLSPSNSDLIFISLIPNENDTTLTTAFSNGTAFPEPDFNFDYYVDVSNSSHYFSTVELSWQEIQPLTSDLQTESFLIGPNGAPNVSKSVFYCTASASGCSATADILLTTNFSTATFASNIQHIRVVDTVYNPNVSVSAFSNTFSISSGTVPAAVPGPLPVLGAGAALGWSRRLRSRVKGRA